VSPVQTLKKINQTLFYYISTNNCCCSLKTKLCFSSLSHLSTAMCLLCWRLIIGNTAHTLCYKPGRHSEQMRHRLNRTTDRRSQTSRRPSWSRRWEHCASARPRQFFASCTLPPHVDVPLPQPPRCQCVPVSPDVKDKRIS